MLGLVSQNVICYTPAMEKIKAVVVLSGGQDSALCLALAVRKYGAGTVAAITFRYGQRHAVETKYARRIAKHFGVSRHAVVGMDFYRHLTDNALFSHSAAITRASGRSCPNTVVEGRNAFFLLAAGVWAKSLGATEIYTGVSQADYSGYPDCRRPFIRAQERMMRLAMEWPFKIVTPFMDKTKEYEWALAAKLGVFDMIANETVTCYNGIPGAGCGKCPACRLRNAGLREYLAKRQSSSSTSSTTRKPTS